MKEDEALSSSPLANAFRVLRQHGIWRQVPLVLALLLSSSLEGLGIGTLLPVLKTVLTSTAHTPTQIEGIIFGTLDFLHLPTSFGSLVLVFAVCMVGRAMISKQIARYMGRMVAKIATELRQEVLDRVLAARWSYFTVNPIGKFLSALNVEANWASYVYRTSLNVLSNFIRAGIYCLIGLLIDWRAALIALAMGVGLGLVNRYYTRMARRAGRNQQVAMRGLVTEFGDVITSFKPLKAMFRHEALIKGLTKEARRVRRAMYDIVVSQQLANAVPDLLITIVLVAAIYIYHLLGLKLEVIGVSGLLILRLMNSVSAVQRALQETATCESYYWALQSTIREAREAEESFPGRETPKLSDAIRFEKVSFSYGEKPVLNDVSLEIPAGRVTTLVGESGSGKTTIADLLLGLFTIDAGSLTLDGRPLREIDLKQWRSMVGYVPQEILLFNGSIIENVALGDPAISEADVRRALEDAGALGFVEALPDGVRAPVGERGALLSGGQRQRIALARALVHRPALLILDEATSALDPQTEAEICEAVRRQAGQMTVLAITHQPGWVEIADRVYRVVNGKVEPAERSDFTQVAAASH
jgi:ATP-binding cassette subfamily C protein